VLAGVVFIMYFWADKLLNNVLAKWGMRWYIMAMKQQYDRHGLAVSSFHEDNNQSDHTGAGTHTLPGFRDLINFGLVVARSYKGHYGFTTSDHFFDVTRSYGDQPLPNRKQGYNRYDGPHFEIQGLAHDNRLRFLKAGMPLSAAILDAEGAAQIRDSFSIVPGFGVASDRSHNPGDLRFSPGHFVEGAIAQIGHDARKDAWLFKGRAEDNAVNEFLDEGYGALEYVHRAQNAFLDSRVPTVEGPDLYDETAKELLTVGALALHGLYTETVGTQE